jgi:hypothetical protein
MPLQRKYPGETVRTHFLEVPCHCCGKMFKRLAYLVQASIHRGANISCSRTCINTGRRRVPDRQTQMAVYRQTAEYKARKKLHDAKRKSKQYGDYAEPCLALRALEKETQSWKLALSINKQ